mgnify:CR=1 FL=1
MANLISYFTKDDDLSASNGLEIYDLRAILRFLYRIVYSVFVRPISVKKSLKKLFSSQKRQQEKMP